jgi:hypothetical protein
MAALNIGTYAFGSRATDTIEVSLGSMASPRSQRLPQP